jgi:nucleoside-diphosphate-sugar epimerase
MILVSGGAGVMGRRLIAGLRQRGDQVRALDRPGTHLENIDLRHGDVSDARTLLDVFDGVGTVYHLAAVLIARDPSVFERINVRGTRNMVAAAAAAGVKHFIFVSSASVVYPHTTPYSLSKRQGEEIVRQQNTMNWTIVRPTLAYNEFGGEEFRMFAEFLKKYPIVPFIGRGHALKNPVHVDDLVQGLLAISGNAKTYGKTYALSGGEEIKLVELARLILQKYDMPKPIVPVPVWLCRILVAIFERTMKNPSLTRNVLAGLTQDANLDHSLATADLGYRPIGIREGLRKI